MRWPAAPLAVVSESPAPPDLAGRWIQVAHGRQALSLAARNFFGRPDERLALTGITGTNGKTTTAYLIDSVLRAGGKTTAMIGTIEYHLAGRVLKAVNTTPESLDLLRLFAELENAGGTHVTMEVSSHALALGRVYGLQFPHRRLHQPDARPSGFSRRHGNLLRRQAVALRRRRRSTAALRRAQSRRRVGAPHQSASPKPKCSGTVWARMPLCARAISPPASAGCASTCSTASSVFPWNRR